MGFESPGNRFRSLRAWGFLWGLGPRGFRVLGEGGRAVGGFALRVSGQGVSGLGLRCSRCPLVWDCIVPTSDPKFRPRLGVRFRVSELELLSMASLIDKNPVTQSCASQAPGEDPKSRSLKGVPIQYPLVVRVPN